MSTAIIHVKNLTELFSNRKKKRCETTTKLYVIYRTQLATFNAEKLAEMRLAAEQQNPTEKKEKRPNNKQQINFGSQETRNVWKVEMKCEKSKVAFFALAHSNERHSYLM